MKRTLHCPNACISRQHTRAHTEAPHLHRKQSHHTTHLECREGALGEGLVQRREERAPRPDPRQPRALVLEPHHGARGVVKGQG